MFNKKIKNMQIISPSDVLVILIVSIIVLTPFISVLANKEPEVKPEVSARELAMFASIAYADIEKISGKNYSYDSETTNLRFESKEMFTDDDLKSLTSSTVLLGFLDMSGSGEVENTYDYLFYKTGASMKELDGWELMNYSKIKTLDRVDNMALFTGMTFRKGNNIVIAFRGTDFDDIGDWAQDLFGYGIAGDTVHQSVAEQYAIQIARKAIKADANAKIYVTGHSLGGFLAQIGGAALLDTVDTKDHVEEIAYFNGMGLHFFSGFENKINEIKNLFNVDLFNAKEIKEFKSKILNNFDSLAKLTKNEKIKMNQDKAKEILSKWYKDGGKLIAYRIKGDLVSSLGTHYGEIKDYNADEKCITHHNGNTKTTLAKARRLITQTIAQGLNKLGFLNTDIKDAINKYNAGGKLLKDQILNYVWITHETDSFLGVKLDEPSNKGIVKKEETNKGNSNQPTEKIYIKAELKVPSKIKLKKTGNATLVITTNGKLNNTNLNKNNLKISTSILKTKVSVNSISGPSVKTSGNVTTYTYTITLKAGVLLENIKLTLNSGVFEASGFNQTIKNEKATSSKINIRLL